MASLWANRRNNRSVPVRTGELYDPSLIGSTHIRKVHPMSDQVWLKPNNWDKFQHYRDRRPPWIKLHRELLDDRKYACLPIASKALAPLLWLLASEHPDGIFDGSTEELTFRLRMSAEDVEAGKNALISAGFFVHASKVLAGRFQRATPERESETESEVESLPERIVRLGSKVIG